MKPTIIAWIAVVVAGAGIWLVARTVGDTSTESEQNTNAATNVTAENTNMSSTAQSQLDQLEERPTATVETTLGTFTVKFYTTAAPELTTNFIELAKTGYYDGLTFHRIIPGFVVQGGDPSGDGTGGRSYKGEGTGLADEPGALGLQHLAGSVAWAKSSLPNSIGSQFYIALDELPQLDGGYSVFGHVTDGFDVIEQIAAVQTDANDKPVDPVTITKVTINQ